jgi:acetyl-CoA acetyltransferase
VREVHLLGVGVTSFSRTGRSAGQLATEAAAAALADAGVSSRDVEAFTFASAAPHAPSGLALLGNGGGQPYPPVCTSGATALHLAWRAVATGAHDVVLCLGQELAEPGAPGGHADGLEDHAASAERYMRASGASEKHFARVAAKNRSHGAANPHALLTSPVDVAAVLESDLLVWPLRSLMVARASEGAAAVVLGSSDLGRHGRARAPRVRASVLVRQGESAALATAARAARLTYEAAGMGPEDVDCAEIDDPTAAGELPAYEALEFAPDGQGPELVDSGFTALGGVLPVNTSGGALAQGHAPGAAGIAQLCELGWQLRGEAGRRQVAGARVGLALSTPVEKGDRVVALTVLSSG